MARKRNIVERTPRSSQKLYPEVRSEASFLAMARLVRRFPVLSRVWLAHEQRQRAKDGKKKEREKVLADAWDVLAKEFGEERLRGKLDRKFLSACADALDAAGVSPPEDVDELGWRYSSRVRDLIRRHR
jgi:hypothetical protein